MAIFGFYFVTSLLREAGWPRKQGIFKGEAYDTWVVDAIIDQMVDWGAALRAGRPRLALQVVAELFRDRDWSAENAPQIRVFIDGAQDSWNRSDSSRPSDIIKPVRLTTSFGKSIGVKQFTDARMRMALEQSFLETLLWGLANPDRFGSWYEAYAKKHESSLGLYRSAGLAVDAPASLSEFFEHSESILRDYERDVGPLPAIPPKLLADARSLGRTIED